MFRKKTKKSSALNTSTKCSSFASSKNNKTFGHLSARKQQINYMTHFFLNVTVTVK